MLNTYGTYKITEIRDDLMQMDATDSEAIGNLISALVLLCDKIGDLDYKLRQQLEEPTNDNT